ncbi:MAG: hypothetical protein ACRDOP_09080, partial [Gaiellaceae bacterium]
MVVGPRGLEDGGQPLEALVREKRSEALAHLAGADVGVAVAVRAERCRRVVDVQAAQAVEPDAAVDVGDGLLHDRRVG